jgi:hypothetical protein
MRDAVTVERKRHMRTVYRLLAVGCLSFTGFAGCAADHVSDVEDTTGTEASSRTILFRYGRADIAALAPGKFLRLELTVPDAVYSVTYTDPADLDRVLIVGSTGPYVLGDRVPAAATAQTDALKQVIVYDDVVVEPQTGDSVTGPSGDAIVHCTCPCDLQVAGRLVYCI